MTAPDWLYDAIFYQIFPDRFANADPALDPPGVEPWDSAPTRENFLGGDLKGIVAHLDHIVSVGANALYLTPIFAADTNHRYDCTDYFAIDPHLGTLADFHALLEACHARGIRVVLDAVLNHCGYGHWAFQDVIAHEEASPYVNWFSVEGFPVSPKPKPNYRTCSGYWAMPKWNAYNPEVRAHHDKVARYWIEQGIDGWRLDVPYFITMPFWRGFRDAVKGIDPDLYIVAEEWHYPLRWLKGDTADGTMNYALRNLILGFCADRTLDAAGFADGLNHLNQRIPEGFHHGMLNLVGSHDTERILTRCGGDEARTRLAFTALLCAQGAPMVYYGDEVGMAGENDPGCRAGMVWDERRWSAPMFGHLRALTGLRQSYAALRRGTQAVSALGTDTVLMSRQWADETVVAILHRGAGTTVPGSALPGTGADGRSFAIPAASSVVLVRPSPAGEWTVAL